MGPHPNRLGKDGLDVRPLVLLAPGEPMCAKRAQLLSPVSGGLAGKSPFSFLIPPETSRGASLWQLVRDPCVLGRKSERLEQLF